MDPKISSVAFKIGLQSSPFRINQHKCSNQKCKDLSLYFLFFLRGWGYRHLLDLTESAVSIPPCLLPNQILFYQVFGLVFFFTWRRLTECWRLLNTKLCFFLEKYFLLSKKGVVFSIFACETLCINFREWWLKFAEHASYQVCCGGRRCRRYEFI